MTDPTLFDAPAGILERPRGIVVGMAKLAQTSARAKNAKMIEALIPVALRLAQSAGDGITVSDLRKEAVSVGVLAGTETGKTLSYLGSVMKAAGLRASGQTRRSPLAVTHGIRQVVWYAD